MCKQRRRRKRLQFIVFSGRVEISKHQASYGDVDLRHREPHQPGEFQFHQEPHPSPHQLWDDPLEPLGPPGGGAASVEPLERPGGGGGGTEASPPFPLPLPLPFAFTFARGPNPLAAFFSSRARFLACVLWRYPERVPGCFGLMKRCMGQCTSFDLCVAPTLSLKSFNFCSPMLFLMCPQHDPVTL